MSTVMQKKIFQYICDRIEVLEEISCNCTLKWYNQQKTTTPQQYSIKIKFCQYGYVKNIYDLFIFERVVNLKTNRRTFPNLNPKNKGEKTSNSSNSPTQPQKILDWIILFCSFEYFHDEPPKKTHLLIVFDIHK